MSNTQTLSNTETDSLNNSYFIKACRGEPVKKIPIWLMRQAGRYLPEYQKVRKGVTFLELCRSPELATEATVSAQERLNVDAAIIFSDILVPLVPMGLDLDFHEQKGPVISNPIRLPNDLERLSFDKITDKCPFLFEAIKQTRKRLQNHIPLIGFAGAPFTLASYMIEGKSSKNFIATKILMHDYPEAWHTLMTHLSDVLITYLNKQIEAGCQAVQLFDSWVGQCCRNTFLEKVAPYTKKIISGLTKNVPVIYFGTHTSHLIDDMITCGETVIGIDTQTDIAKVMSKYKGNIAFQGNFDPILLFASKKTIIETTTNLLNNVGHIPGYIFNLGHGILPETPVDHVLTLIDTINDWSASHL